MRKYIYCLFCVLLLLSCSEKRVDEDAVAQTVESFYKFLNKRNFREVESLCSDNMSNTLKVLKDSREDIILYRKYTVKSVDISAETALVEVETVEEFGNDVDFEWELVKINDTWKINGYNFSHAEELSSQSGKDALIADTLSKDVQ